jgi:hypothetical protein
MFAEILPKLDSVRPADIDRTLAVSATYAIEIRLGRSISHPRFYTKLMTLCSSSIDLI